MLRENIRRENLSFREKILALDFYLIFFVLLLGTISCFAMFSSEQGKIGYFTQSHIYRFFTFFMFFIIISFINISLLYKFSYFFYFIVLALLFAVDSFGITSSGSKRWINLFFINIQPSELMKVSLIAFLARYYYKIPIENVTSFKYIFVPIFALSIPVALVNFAISSPIPLLLFFIF